jgi:hypothetical protein
MIKTDKKLNLTRIILFSLFIFCWLYSHNKSNVSTGDTLTNPPTISKRIAMVTISTPNRTEFSQYTIESFTKYAEKWNYDLYFSSTTLDKTRPIQWSKIKAVLEVLKTNKYDWVAWFDDDIYITNPDISLEKFIKENGQKAFFIISAHKTNIEKNSDLNNVNSGLFLVKNTQDAKNFLTKVWDIGNSRYNQEKGSFWEQSAITELLKTQKYKNSKQISRLPAKKIQSFITIFTKGDTTDYGQWEPGDFAAHLAGTDDDCRVIIIEQLAKNPKEYPSFPDFA